MSKWLNVFLNILIGLSVGALLVYSAYQFWDYTAHPELYLPYPAPWYLGIQIYGTLTAVFLAVVLGAKRLLNKKPGQS